MKKWLAVLLSLGLMAGCSKEEPVVEKKAEKNDTLKDVSIVLDWTPNTNHTGIYVAKEKGYFEDAGLDVEIIMPGEAGADQLVASGKSEFGVGYQEAITQARIQDVPIVSIAAIIQHNTSGFASPESKGIKTPKDFEGKTYGGWGSPVEKQVITSLMNEEKGDAKKVDIVSMGDTDFFTAVKRDIDFAWIYYGWTGVEAELRGEKLNMVYLTDYSDKLDYYTPVLTTSEKMIEEDPETVRAFVNAVSKGYDFAIENPSEAADVLIKAVPDLDPKLVKKSQEWLSPKYKDDAPRWGEQTLYIWENYANWMYENGLLEKPLDAKKAFNNQFLPK
ncbi:MULTISPECIES: ABC transporter substrate-binding protein [unclassified Bacillus (in: firmicutes)]|uniref:ABC transporter substrate-binding protein n=1 Tax=unclassified Bacillus (in: firmicutes) TaxID=185979 RepID=UPI0008F0F011|nr:MULTISPECIES: ABC transporter substrate-binding protein [unclassified Bacillus (in: firmicutes)]SFA70534.1 ABC-type nitrate/sulfonate/bicarbonate transport system, substrate-binding protein [Bacillus sp. UNCCL13]SFQ60379.1 ABC-type nitrate/sulfonate/bicarbonate transport system, substrate-binding protein [Bacillus sp. cl95]